MKQYRSLILRAATGQVRFAQFEQREHVVVPVIMLVEGVIHASNAANPELVLASEFTHGFGGWNGEPVLPDHPVLNGQKVSANIPVVLELLKFGQLFNTSVADKKLATEAWLDPVRAKVVGKNAERVIERARASEAIEVSVGAYTVTEDVRGEHNGKRYNGVWRNITPDHLAMLPEGTTGACSVAAGCGAPRSALAYNLVTASGIEFVSAATEEPMPEATKPKEEKPRTLRERLLALMKFRGAADDGMSDNVVREKLHAALFSSEPAFQGIDAVFHDTKLVVYAVSPDNEWKLFQRSFTISDGGDVTLGGEKTEVDFVGSYEPVTAEAGDCGCKKPASGDDKMTKTDRIKALIASPKLAFKEADTKFLEALPDERLAEFETKAKAEEPSKAEEKPKVEEPKVEAKPAAEVKAAAAVVAKTPEELEAEFFATAPSHLRTLVEDAKAREATRSAELVAVLKSAQDAYTEDELKKLPVKQLELLAKVARVPVLASSNVIDFGSRGMPRSPDGDDDKIPPPPDLTKAIRVARGLETASK